MANVSGSINKVVELVDYKAKQTDTAKVTVANENLKKRY